MDVNKMLAELNAERDAINAAIASLERLARTRSLRGFPAAAGLLVTPQIGALLSLAAGPARVRAERGRTVAKKH